MNLEPRQCPKEFQDRITRKFGKTPFGDPIFRLMWGQSVTIRMGCEWTDEHGFTHRGYQEKLAQFGMPCWVLQRWRSAKEYGTPTLYYQQTWNPMTRLFDTGEYPWKGRHETLQPLYHKSFERGKLIIEHMPLDSILIDRMIPLMLKAQQMSYWEKKVAQDLAKKQEHDAEVATIADALEDAHHAWLGPVSFSRQGCRTSWLDKKMTEIERTWNRMKAHKRDWRKGFFQGRKFYN